jgi:hypothetical protein
MSAREYSFDEMMSAEQYKSCGLQQLEIEAINHADEFFRINLTGDSRSIAPGIYQLEDLPTNQIPVAAHFGTQV